MALKLKYTDEHGILHINMSPTSSAKGERKTATGQVPKTDIDYPKFDTINNRFGQYDIFGGKYDVKNNDSEDESSGDRVEKSLFTARYNSIEEELANTPYAFKTDRRTGPLVDLTIRSTIDSSPSKDIEDDRFFNRTIDVEYDGLFGPQIDLNTKTVKSDSEDDLLTPAFTVTQLIHAQDRYFDLSTKSSVLKLNENSDIIKCDSKSGSASNKSVRELTNRFEIRSAPCSAKNKSKIGDKVCDKDEAFKVLHPVEEVKAVQKIEVSVPVPVSPVISTAKRKRESSFAIIAETPSSSRPTSPRSLPIEIRHDRISPFRGKGFREETSRHNTPKTSRASSRVNSPIRRRTNSLSKIEGMAQTATLPPIVHSRPHSPRNYIKENIEEVREMSELNREMHEAEAEQKKREEEEALLKEMGLLDQNAKLEPMRSLAGSRNTSRSNSPTKIKIRSRSNSPSAAILLCENIPNDSKDFINLDDGTRKPVLHNSRVRSISRSQPQSNNGSPQHSKIPKRQNSVSPTRTANKRDSSLTKKPIENNLNKNQRFISSSTSSIHETIKIGGTSSSIKKNMSKSSQHLSISPTNIRGKPPISPGRGGPPPSNRAINAKRLSPIVGTPNKSPMENSKPGSARTPTKSPSPITKKPIKTVGNTPATSRFNSRQQSRTSSRSHSPDKKKDIQIKSTAASRAAATKPSTNKSVTRTPSTRSLMKSSTPIKTTKTETQKTINRTNSIKSLNRTPSTKTLNTKPPILKKKDSMKDLKDSIKSVAKTDEAEEKSSARKEKKQETPEDTKENKKISTNENNKQESTTVDHVEKPTQDSETQYDKITNEKGELIILTKKNIVSMTTAAITAQPLEVVTTVTNQLPAALEKAREKGIFERLSSKDSLAPKEDEERHVDEKDSEKETKVEEESKPSKPEQNDTKPKIQPISQSTQMKNTIVVDDSIKLRPLQPPFNNPQVAKAKQKIDDILKAPEVSPENILKAVEAETKSARSSFRNIADRTKNDVKESKGEKFSRMLMEEKISKLIKEEKQKAAEAKDQVVKETEKTTEEIRSEASKIVDSIITPIEEPSKEILDDLKVKAKDEIKKNIEPIVMVVNEKRNGPKTADTIIKMNETLVKGDPEVEVQSSNVSTPDVGKMTAHNKLVDSNSSDQSAHSNGGFPQSTSTTPKPPPRGQKTTKQDGSKEGTEKDQKDLKKKKNMPQRLLGKCAQKTKCCACCVKPEVDDADDDLEKAKKRTKGEIEETKTSTLSKLNCFNKKVSEDQEVAEKDVKTAKVNIDNASRVEFENETKRKRGFRDVFCGCCTRKDRVGDSAADVTASPTNQGCCGRRAPPPERRDSILSEQSQKICCNNRFCNWLCRRQPAPSRRNSVFSKNKSLSPTLPPEVLTHKAISKKVVRFENMEQQEKPVKLVREIIMTDVMKSETDLDGEIEDTRSKLDPSLVEHSSVMRGAVPVLPIALAYFCLFCNIIVPGLGTVFSGVFCLCFGIPRFGVHDSAKHRFGSFMINIVVGCGQLFTVLFCLVGWGWSIWWGVLMVRVARKYRRLAAEAKAEEEEQAPPVVANNHHAGA